MSQRPKLKKKVGALMVTIQQHTWCVASDSRSMLDFSVYCLDAVDSAGGWVGVDGWTLHHQDVSTPHLVRLQCDRHTMNSRDQSSSRLPGRIWSLQMSTTLVRGSRCREAFVEAAAAQPDTSRFQRRPLDQSEMYWMECSSTPIPRSRQMTQLNFCSPWKKTRKRSVCNRLLGRTQ